MADPLPAPPRRALPRTALTLLLFAAAAAVPYAVPALARYRFVRPGEAERAFSLAGRVPVVQWKEKEERREPAAEVATAPDAVRSEESPREAPAATAAPPSGPRKGEVAEAVDSSLEDEAGAMNPFFAKLLRTERREAAAVTRISHFGDSPLTGDLISGEARARFQAAYGDAGHGFILAGRPWGWYGHDGVALKASHWKTLSPLLTPGDGGFHGLGAVSFSGGASARTEIVLERGAFSRLEVTYLVRPGGGRFTATVDDEPPTETSTDGPARREGIASIRLGKEARRVVLTARGDGPVSLHGAVLERDGPGVVYDALGANGAAVHMLTLLDAEGWVQALAARRSDLVILSYGTNESGYDGIPGTRYRLDWIEVVGRIRRALPGVSILIMAPMDRGARREDGSVGTMPAIPKIVDAQRKIAAETGCAFFDTYSAMGGEGTMARWYAREPRLVSGDFTHTTKGGSDRVARLLVGAIQQSYGRWREANAPAAKPEGAPAAAAPAVAAGAGGGVR